MQAYSLDLRRDCGHFLAEDKAGAAGGGNNRVFILGAVGRSCADRLFTN